MSLTQEYFSDMSCDNEECDHDDHRFYMHSRCHPSAATWSHVDTDRPEELIITCSECKEKIASIAIARAI